MQHTFSRGTRVGFTAQSVAARAALALAAALAACTSAAERARPLGADRWPHVGDPRVEACPFVVEVFQRTHDGAVVIGNGAVVHACSGHGTLVLTAFHVVGDDAQAGIWTFDAEGSQHDYEADVVFPLPEPDDGLPFSPGDIRRAFFPLVQDYALLRVRGDPRFPVVPLAPLGAGAPALGTAVELAAIAPEGYPHRHLGAWEPSYSEEFFLPGHSGAPILVGGALYAIVGTRFASSEIIAQRPTIEEMRKTLAEAGFGYALDPDSCRGAMGASSPSAARARPSSAPASPP